MSNETKLQSEIDLVKTQLEVDLLKTQLALELEKLKQSTSSKQTTTQPVQEPTKPKSMFSKPKNSWFQFMMYCILSFFMLAIFKEYAIQNKQELPFAGKFIVFAILYLGYFYVYNTITYKKHNNQC